jgi:hypothetical protein
MKVNFNKPTSKKNKQKKKEEKNGSGKKGKQWRKKTNVLRLHFSHISQL